MVELLDDNEREMFNERAGIREHDGGLERAHAEALALLDVLDSYPEALTNLVVFQIDDRFFVADSTELAHEHAAKIGGNVRAQRSVGFVVEEELGGLAELIVAA